ncbi:MAG: ATP-binding protein [Verrucomicrobiota bacterium]
MLTKLTIKNFKRFRDETVVNFEPITVLLGGNNSGKSTVLQALSIFQYCMEVTRKRKNGGFTLDTKTIGPEEFGALPVAEPTDLWPDSKPAGAINIEAKFSNDATISFEITMSFNRFSITPALHGEAGKLIETTKVRYVPIHSGLALREGFLLAPERAERLRELQHGSVIRNLLWDLKEHNKERWKKLKEILERLYPTATLDVTFDSQVDRFISSEYQDNVLGRGLDVVVSGTGFQQVLQIFTGVLSQGSTIVLMDEPDAHLHARLQVEMMRIFADLVEGEGLQFVLASHSPHLISAAPPGSLRAMIDGKAHPFATEPEQMDLLDTLGAFDRMEIVPLLRTKSVVFVENRDDRNYLELSARKLWGEAKTRKIWDGLSFLYTYQEPVSADVKRLARQVKDLLNAPGLSQLHGGRQARFLVIGDRDYRSASGSRKARKELEKKAKGEGFKLDLHCSIWSRNEIDNYLLDASAIERAAVKKAKEASQTEAIKTAVQEAIQKSLEAQRPEVQQRIAHKLQQDDPDCRNDYLKATTRSEEILNAEWADGMAVCDAKKLLSQIRAELQSRKLKTALSEADIVAAMDDVPDDVVTVLQAIKGLTKTAAGNRKPKQVTAVAIVALETTEGR